MRVAVIGCAGAMGRVALDELARMPEFSTILAIDITAERAAGVIPPSRADIQACGVDATDEQAVCRLLVDFAAQVVVNCAQYSANVPILRACIAARAHYVDLGGLFHTTRRQLELHDAAREAGISAVLGMGGAPGITNLMARYLCDRLESVESIDVALGSVDETPTDSPFPVPYSIRTILDECTLAPMVYRDGVFVEDRPFGGQCALEMGSPVGTVVAHYSLHSEVATLPLSFAAKGVRSCSFRVAFPSDFQTKLKFLVDLGLGQTTPLTVSTGSPRGRVVNVAPRDVLIALLDRFATAPGGEPRDVDTFRVDVCGTHNGLAVASHLLFTFRPLVKRGISAGAFDTGIPPAIVAAMLGSGEITQRGVVAPETAVDPALFFGRLVQRGPIEGIPADLLRM